MAVGVERALETFRHIMAARVSRSCHHFRGHSATAASPANEEQIRILLHAGIIEKLAQVIPERGIDTSLWKRLAFDHEHAPPKFGDIR